MSATLKAYVFNGAGPTATSDDSVDVGTTPAFKFGRDDALSPATALPIPTATGTHFSYIRYMGLYCTATATTSIFNRQISLASTPSLPAGVALFWGSAASYVQQNGTAGTPQASYPADSASNGATPGTTTGISAWAALTTTPATYDSASISTSTSGVNAINGKYVALVLGVDNTFSGGGGPLFLPDAVFTYSEQ